jgi:hypothetical protein
LRATVVAIHQKKRLRSINPELALQAPLADDSSGIVAKL